ncbi:MAG: cytochrome c [Chloroflexota bacterium]
MKRVQLEIVLGTIFIFLSGALLVAFGLEEPGRLASYENTQRAELIEFGASIYEINCTSCHGSRAQGVEGKAPCLRCREFFAPIAITIDGEIYEVNADTEVASGVVEGRKVRVEYADENGTRIATLVEVVGSDVSSVSSSGVATGIVDKYQDRIGELGWEGSLEDYVVSVVSTGRQVSTRPQYFGAGLPAMPTWGDKYGGPLRVDQVAAVAAFVINFESWALNPSLIPDPIFVEVDSSDPALRGRALFAQLPCTACHAVTGTSSGIGGPSLDGVATRAANSVDGLSAEEYLRQSILDPSAYVVEDYLDGLMPANFADLLSPEQLEDLIAFLLTLEE